MKPELKTKLDQVNDQIKQLETDAQSKWAAFEKARDEFAASGSDVNDTESDQFKAAHEAQKQYGEIKDQITSLEDVRTGVYEMATKSAPTPAQAAAAISAPAVQGEVKSLVTMMADRILGSEEFKGIDIAGKAKSSAPMGTQFLGKGLDAMETKALITGLSDTSAGAFITNQRVGFVPDPQRRRSVLDLLTVGTTGVDAVEYARQTAFTNAAAQVPEATATTTGTKPEATIAFEKVTETVKTIANWVPASRQSLADAGQLRMIIEQQLRYALEKYLEEQILNGAGTGGDFTGIIQTSGILSQAKGSDSVVDAVHKGITQIRLGFVEPSGVVLHPNDWQVVRLSRDDGGASAGTGNYLYGPPALAGAEQMWGLPVVVTAACPDDTGLVGDFKQAALWVREGVQVLASDSHSDFFVKNLIVVLAEMRAAFGVLMPKAFCKVTSVD